MDASQTLLDVGAEMPMIESEWITEGEDIVWTFLLKMSCFALPNRFHSQRSRLKLQIPKFSNGILRIMVLPVNSFVDYSQQVFGERKRHLEGSSTFDSGRMSEQQVGDV